MRKVEWRRGRWRDKCYPLSSLCGHMSFLYPAGWVFLEGDAHLTWYHCLMHYSVVDRWHLKSTANTSILNPFSHYKSFLQHLPQTHASSPDSLSDRAVTQGCLLPKTVWEDLRKGLWGSRVRACSHLQGFVGGWDSELGFLKVSAVRKWGW